MNKPTCQELNRFLYQIVVVTEFGMISLILYFFHKNGLIFLITLIPYILGNIRTEAFIKQFMPRFERLVNILTLTCLSILGSILAYFYLKYGIRRSTSLSTIFSVIIIFCGLLGLIFWHRALRKLIQEPPNKSIELNLEQSRRKESLGEEK